MGKVATVRFKKFSKETLLADFLFMQNELDEIKTLLETEKSIDRVYNIELKDKIETVCCFIEKTIYIAKKR